MKNKWIMQSLLVSLLFFGFTLASAQNKKTIVTNIFTVVYSEDLRATNQIKIHNVECPTGECKV